jgi:hypothetical protein
MTGLEQFIASLVHSLAWPAAVIVPAVVFRKQIGGLLESPMRRLRAGPVEVEFERVFARVEADVPIDAPPSERESGVTSELSELAKRVPSAAILEAFSRVEHRLRELLEADGETPAPLGPVALARIAERRGLITSDTVDAIEGIAVLRNLVAHDRTAPVAVDRARDYLYLVDAVLYTMRRPPEDKNGLAPVPVG